MMRQRRARSSDHVLGAYLAIELLREQRHLLNDEPWGELREFDYERRDRFGTSCVV